jgi:alpha-tubulin suppressor-like RCC1 family protein
MRRHAVTDARAAAPGYAQPRSVHRRLGIVVVALLGTGILGGCSLDPLGRQAGFSAVPTLVDGARLFATIGSGNLHTCAVSMDAITYCWGENEYAQLGTVEPMERCAGLPCTGTPRAVAGAPALRQVGGGTRLTCGLDVAGAAYCWGDGDSIGGIVAADARPRKIAGGLTFERLTMHASSDAVCGLASDSLHYCWGRGSYGMPWTGSENPVALDTPLTFSAVTVGEQHMCALTLEGAGYCWGANWSGQLGIGWYGADVETGGATAVATPQLVHGGHTFTQLEASSMFTCGLTVSGIVYCWGSLVQGTSSNVPQLVGPAPRFASLHVGPLRACALTDSGDAYCWGSNGFGALGDGSLRERTTPVLVEGGLAFTELTVATTHTCGLTRHGRAYCWGSNSHGQIGRRHFGTDRGRNF